MKNLDLTKELKNYENKWVALSEKTNRVVGSGLSVTEAKKDAEKSGEKDYIFYKVLPFDKGYSS